MNLLSINTSRKNTVISLNDVILSSEPHKSQNEELLKNIQVLLKQAQLKLEDLTAISVVAGPGSFTGLRIGVMTAKTLAWSLGIPLYAFNALELWAQVNSETTSNSSLVSLVDTWTGSYYSCCLDASQKKTFAELTLQELEDLCKADEKVWLDKYQIPPQTFFLGGEVPTSIQERFSSLLPSHFKNSLKATETHFPALMNKESTQQILSKNIGSDPLTLRPLYMRESEPERLLKKKANL